jgi:hypothetical protein
MSGDVLMRRWKPVLSHFVALVVGGVIGAGGVGEHEVVRTVEVSGPCPTLFPGHDPDAAALAAIEGARSYVSVTCPRLSSIAIASALSRARERGVDVEVTLEASIQDSDPLRMVETLENAGITPTLSPSRLPDSRRITVDRRILLIDGHGPVER